MTHTRAGSGDTEEHTLATQGEFTVKTIIFGIFPTSLSFLQGQQGVVGSPYQGHPRTKSSAPVHAFVSLRSDLYVCLMWSLVNKTHTSMGRTCKPHIKALNQELDRPWGENAPVPTEPQAGIKPGPSCCESAVKQRATYYVPKLWVSWIWLLIVTKHLNFTVKRSQWLP